MVTLIIRKMISYSLQPALAVLIGVQLFGNSCYLPGECDQIQYDIYALILEEYQGRRPPIVLCRQTNIHDFLKEGTADVITSDADVSSPPVESAEHDAAALPDRAPSREWQVSASTMERMSQVFPDIDASTVLSFHERNLGPQVIEGSRISVKGVRLSQALCVEEMSRVKGVQFVELSNVGIGGDMSQVVVYFGLLEGSSGRGWFVLFERRGGEWIELRRIQAWVA